MATIAEQVQQVYIGLLGRAAEKAGLDYWVEEITTGKITLDQVRANFVSSQDEYITGIGQMSRPDAITALYQNLFERSPEAEGLAYWNTGAGKDIEIDGLLFALIDGAALSDATALDNKTEVADYYTAATASGQAYDAAKAAAVIANVGADSQSVIDGKALVDGVNGQSLSLTTDQDNIAGTEQSDTFNAYIFDNDNTAQSGDKIDGGTGTDRLYADIGESQDFAITLHTESVEQFAVRGESAQNNDSSDNNNSNFNVTIDAERMEGTNWYESNNSRADVIIEDVRIERVAAYNDATDQITRDITIAMVSTDPGDVDLGVYFDQHSLVKSGAAVSNSITLNVGNQLETLLGFEETTPLKDIPYDQVSFVVNSTTVTLNIDLTGVETYAQMYTQLQAAFATEKQTNAALLDVNLTRTLLTEDFISKDGENRQADEYILTTENGTIEPALVGWNASAGLPSNNAFSASVVKGDTTTTSSLITSTVVLDDVGRGSQGGDLIIGGLSTGITSDSKGVEQFDITVERSSQLGEIQSTNNTLREVYIKNGDVKGDLVVAGINAVNGQNNYLPGQDVGQNGFDDVRVIDASAMEGKVSIQAALSGEVVEKYLDSKDDATDATADNVDFLYKLGTNDDTLDLSISNANLAAAGTSTREDFVLNIEGNGGDDTITTQIETGFVTDTEHWYINSQLNANLSIDAGAGDDTVTTSGAGDFKIDAGTGNDTVYANNDAVAFSFGPAWAVNTVDNATTSLDLGDLHGAGEGAKYLAYKSAVTVTFSGANTTGASGVSNGAAAQTTNGFESTVTLGTLDYFATAAQLNQAIKEAINSDPVLSKLLVATDGPAHTLVIKSLVDGRYAEDDLAITVTGLTNTEFNALSASEKSALQDAYEIQQDDSTAVLADTYLAAQATALETAVVGVGTAELATNGFNDLVGVESRSVSDNTITLGAGDDVAVLGTDYDSSDTLIFEGNFGNDTIFNFSQTDSTSTEGDFLDFNAYLGGMKTVTGSSSDASQTDIANAAFISTVAHGDVKADDIVVINNFDSTVTATETWDNLTASILEKAINSTTNTTGSDDYANLDEATLDVNNSVAAGNTFVGTTQKNVILIENDANLGEYKVFEVTSSTSTDEFTDVALVGTIDLGNTLTDTSAFVV